MPRGFIPVAHCASIEMIYNYNGIVAENVLHVRKGGPYSAADLTALRTLVNTWDSTDWLASRCSSVSLFRIRTKALDTVGSPMEDYYLPVPRGGNVAGSVMPANATFCVKLSSGLTGRSYRGRLYVVGVSVSSQGATSNQVSVAAANFYVSKLNLLMAQLAAAGHTLGIVSYRADKAWRAAGLFTPATSWVAVDYNIDSMRRRLTGRGIT